MAILTRLATPVSLAALLAVGLPAMAQAAPDVKPHIIGGVEATIEEAPWQVGLMFFGAENPRSATGCGGSVISAEWVVTAAHCVDFLTSPGELQVTAGVTTLPDSDTASVPRYAVERILIHPDWNATSYYADVALLKLATPLPVDGVTIAPISLPTFASWPAAGTTALITGWGNSRSQTDPAYLPALRKADISVLAGPGEDACGQYPAYPAPSGYDPEVMLCAGKETPPLIDACQGDSGGPLAIQRDGQWWLAGITSWGIGCAEPGFPGIYTRVTAFTNWIRSAQAEGATGSITVTASGSARVTCAFVYNAKTDAGPIATRCADPGSSITVPDVFPGDYLVRNTFEGRYASETWVSTSGATLQRASASSIRVAGGRAASATNSTIAGTAMSFTLPSAASTLGPDLCVYVYAVSEDLESGNCLRRGATSLDVVSVPPSAEGYSIFMLDGSVTYASYYYTGEGQSGSAAYEQALIVSSAVNSTTAISLTLTRAARISGTVALGEGGDPGGLVELTVVGIADPARTVTVGGDGTYSIVGLPPGTYEVGAFDPEGLHKPQWWQGAPKREAATPLSIAAGSSTTNISMRLAAAGVISGTVTGPRGAALSAEADLSAVLYRDDARVASTPVAADGTYFFGALDAGDYKVDFRDEGGVYYSEFYGGSPDLAGARVVRVAAGAATSGIDMALTLIQRIEITASRTGKGAKSQIVVKGTTTGLAGSRVTPWIKVAEAKRFVPAKPVTVRANGTFTWTYRSPKAASVYVKAGSVRSATVQVRSSS